MSYEIAKNLLSATEKERLVCIALNWTGDKVNWEKAASEFGSASVESFKKCYYNTLKKISGANGVDGSPKRKADGEAPEGAPQTPKKSQRGRPKKQDAYPQNITAYGKHTASPIKNEPEDGI